METKDMNFAMTVSGDCRYCGKTISITGNTPGTLPVGPMQVHLIKELRERMAEHERLCQQPDGNKCVLLFFEFDDCVYTFLNTWFKSEGVSYTASQDHIDVKCEHETIDTTYMLSDWGAVVQIMDDDDVDRTLFVFGFRNDAELRRGLDMMEQTVRRELADVVKECYRWLYGGLERRQQQLYATAKDKLKEIEPKKEEKEDGQG